MAAKKTIGSKYKLSKGQDVDLKREVIRDRRGRRITDEYVRRAVADVHEKVGRGRPSLTGRAKTSPQVTFRLPPALRAKAEARAKREGKQVSQVAREALERYLVS
ncbi:MAG: CopG family transcriptional regulator [Actinomycetota bacterium]